MKRTLLCLAVLAMFAPAVLRAQVTGTLAGKVIDDNGKPVAGASVRVGTEFGTRTKPDGKFLLAGIRAGDYTVKVTFVGMQPHEEQVTISPNQTTEINVRLSDKPISKGPINVIGYVKKTQQVGKIGEVKGSQIQEGTRSGSVANAITTNASVSTGSGAISIRGGRGNETKFLQDGVDISDRFIGGGSQQQSTLSVETIQVIASGFDPEYGNVLSGIVNAIGKVGRPDRYEGAVKFTTRVPALYGSSSPITIKKLGSDLDTTLPGAKLQGSGRKTYEFGFGGPIPGTDKVTFFISGNLQDAPFSSAGYEIYDMSPEFAKAREGVAKQVWGLALQPQNLGMIPHSHSMVRNVTAKFKIMAIENLPIEIGAERGWTSREFGSWSSLYQFDHPVINGDTIENVLERDAQQVNQNSNIMRLNTRIQYNLTDASLLELNASYVDSKTETGKKDESKSYGIFSSYDIFPIEDLDNDKIVDRYYSPQVGKVLNSYLDSTVRSLAVPGRNSITGLIEGGEVGGASMNPYGLTGTTFPTHGNDRSMEVRQYTAFTIKGSYENHIDLDSTLEMTFKAGFEFNTTTLRRHDNSLPWDPNPFFDVYGYKTTYFSNDTTGTLASFFEKPYQPVDGAFHVNTRFTYKNIIFSPGVRFDFYAPGIHVAPIKRGTQSEIVRALDTTQVASVKFQISPRIGVSYPITEKSNFRVNFAMMFRRPEYNLMYDNVYNDALRGNQIFGNPDIAPEKMVIYEMGYTANIAELYDLEVSAYYRDIYNQSGITYIPVLPNPYSIYTTQEFGNVRGIEVSLRRNLSDNIRAELNYTLQEARGTASNPTSNYSIVIAGADPITGEKQKFPLTEFPLDYDQTHRANATLSLIWGQNEGPSLGGLKLLENTIITVTATYETGLPYTREDTKGNPITEYNSLRLPSAFNTEAHIERSFKLADWFGESVGKLEIGFFADISNLLNSTGPSTVRLSRTVGSSLFSITASPDFSGQEAKLGDFNATQYYRDVDPNFADSWATTQYDNFGVRYYNPYADINLDGVVTQLEKYESYKRLVTTQQMMRGAYQTPRTVSVGIRLKF